MSGRTMRSRARAAEAGGPSSAVAGEPEAQQSPPAKRAKTQKAKVKKPVTAQNSRKRGRLSVLPSLPLDVLFEIFGHLGPADVLHLARTTKSFRNVLMSRQSAFLWKDVYDALDEADSFPCPEDMSLPNWTNLVYGGPYCDEVGCFGRANKVFWGIRRRLCKSCQDNLLVTGGKVWNCVGEEVMMMDVVITDLVVHDIGLRGTRGAVYLRTDLHDLGDEIRALAKEYKYPMQPDTYPSPKGSPEWEETFTALKARRKNTCTDHRAHARLCSVKDEVKVILRGDELDGLKDARFEDVKQRLMVMGFDAADAGAEEIRVHKEVKQAKPLTDRVWLRIGPVLRAEVERIRDARLERRRRARMTFRYASARRRYEDNILSTVAPSTVCYAPGFSVVFKHPRIATYLKEDVHFDSPSASEFEACATALTEADIPVLISDWISHRQAALRARLPESWPSASYTSAEIETHWPPPTELPSIGHYAELAGLDLAVYTHKCTAPTCQRDDMVFYGLDILAHDCLNCVKISDTGYPTDPDEINHAVDFVLHASPSNGYHVAAIHVVQLLELDPTKARPVDLDRADKFFTGEPREPHPKGQPFFTWRQAVKAGATWCTLDSIRLATDAEKTYIERYRDLFSVFAPGPLHAIDDDPVWACAQCSSLRNPGDALNVPRCSSLADVRVHLVAVHDVANAEEGRHYFYDRSQDRTPDGDGDIFMHLPSTLDVESAIDALDRMGGNGSPFNFFNALWPEEEGPPFWLASLLADLLSDSDSELSTD